MTTLTANEIFRDYNTDGVPASGAFKPIKSQIREYLTDRVENAVSSGGAYVATRSALKAISSPTDVNLAYLGEAGREGDFIWMVGDYSDEVTLDTEEGVFIASTAVAATAGAWVRIFAEAVNAKWFGAVGDGITIDFAALQCWLNVGAFVGAAAYAPAGDYITDDTIIIPPASTSGDPSRAISSFRGQAKGGTAFRLAAGADLPLFSYTGNVGGNGVAAYTTFEKFGIFGQNPAGTNNYGMLLDYMAFFTIRDVFFGGCKVGIEGTDVLSFSVQTCEFRFNGAGIHLATGGFSPPNSITILDCELGVNSDYAIHIVDPGLVRIFGGAIEGNGSGAGDWAVKVEGGGYGAGIGVNIEGVYFENNYGDADIWVKQPNTAGRDRAQYNITGNSFARVDSTPAWATNPIKLECDTGALMMVLIEGNGFRGFNTYAPSAARLYVDVSLAAGTAWHVTYIANYFESSTETPAKSGNQVSFLPDQTGNMFSRSMAIGAANLISGAIQAQVSSGGFTGVAASAHSDTGNAEIIGFRSRGSIASPTIVANSDTLFNFFARGYDGSGYRNSAGIFIEVDGTPGANDMPGRIRFAVSPDGTFTLTEAMRISNAGVLVLTSGQLAFPATAAPSADANTLDDYEEGTFTPTIIGTGTAGAGTYTTQVGRYTKVGDRVAGEIELVWTAHTGTTNMKVAALPFTSGARKSPVSMSFSNLTFAAALHGYVEASATTIALFTAATGAAEAALPIDTAATLRVGFNYSIN